MVIDTTFDFRTDAEGKDPDNYSPTLCRYHQLLWSKPLPSGVVFELVPTSRPPYYLSHISRMGEFVLSSDAFIPAYTRYGVPKTVLEQFSARSTPNLMPLATPSVGSFSGPPTRSIGSGQSTRREAAFGAASAIGWI